MLRTNVTNHAESGAMLFKPIFKVFFRISKTSPQTNDTRNKQTLVANALSKILEGFAGFFVCRELSVPWFECIKRRARNDFNFFVEW